MYTSGSSTQGAPSLWVPITDPTSGELFYANPATGECAWDRTPNMSVMDFTGQEVWWMLHDERNQIPYYYNTVSAVTQWEYPPGGIVVSLINIQKNSIGKRVSMLYQPADSDSEGDASPRHAPATSTIDDYHTLDSLRRSSLRRSSEPVFGTPIDESARAGPSVSGGSEVGPGPGRRFSTLHVVVGMSDIGVDDIQVPASAPPLGAESEVATPISTSAPAFSHMEIATKKMRQAATLQKSSSTTNISGKVAEGGGIGTSSHASVNTTMTRPSDVASIAPAGTAHKDMSQYRIDSFARKYFATHKRGLFRRRVPVEKLLVWSKEQLPLPLMVLSKARHKDALKSYKLIQACMGDGPPTATTTSGSRIVGNGKSNTASVNALHTALLTDVQWLLGCGVQSAEIRDEMYVQLCKQLTQNPSESSCRDGWRVMACLTATFPPSKNFEEYLKSFIAEHATFDGDIGTLATHCARMLDRSCRNGPRGKTPTVAEIDRMLDAAFHPSVFGVSLVEVMDQQRTKHAHLKYPRILTFLARAVLSLGGTRCEGIFRVPGDMDQITELRLRIEANRYDIRGITDPTVPAGLLKFWLRDLSEPLIPMEVYKDCLAHCNEPVHALGVIAALPPLNRDVAQYMLRYLQVIADPANQKYTKMSVQNLAMVFAPNFLRCPSDDPTEIFESTKREQAFLATLIQQAKFPEIQIDKIPWD
ncbi:hypothetical protein GGF31_008839 [Allomyces arbusculus]|nr:hypothetical protein GGF31_008839 [Allomyces arbusculus]